MTAPLTGRAVGVRVRAADEGSLAAAMLEDVVDLVEGMQQVSGALLAPPPAVGTAQRSAWPGMAVLDVLDAPAGATVAADLASLHAAGADEAAVVCPDVPDLPPLLIGKLFSALTSVEVAACPADDGRLVAVASRLPTPGWLDGSNVTLDDADALDRLRASAPRRALHVGAGWDRIRSEADLHRLDAGLE